MTKRICFPPFAGTGNTFLLYRIVCKTFDKAGFSTDNTRDQAEEGMRALSFALPAGNIAMKEITQFADYGSCLCGVILCSTGVVSVKGQGFIPCRAVEYADFRPS